MKSRILILSTGLICGCSDDSLDGTLEVPTSSKQTQTTSERRSSVSPAGICAKIMSKAESSEIWSSWTARMETEEGSCSAAFESTETAFNEDYPGLGRRFLGVYDRCIDQSDSPADYLTCLETEVPLIEARAQAGTLGNGARSERPTQVGRAGKTGKAGNSELARKAGMVRKAGKAGNAGKVGKAGQAGQT